MVYPILNDPESSINQKFTAAYYILLFNLSAAHSTNSESSKIRRLIKKNYLQCKFMSAV
jgi:hypothetical protein